jgi:hypothetical protein
MKSLFGVTAQERARRDWKVNSSQGIYRIATGASIKNAYAAQFLWNSSVPNS